ncbi:RpsD [Desulforapulum autotrophicum HRM2]|uniref:Small ribosomal subunit protein uS4 n=1 Tax=Desulforapulum autotrophicum (strain ATCC 43914 / DSM 3382 / VKM B-1955 / HRM2) TaxID=177437 RepID=RS4_DESAH|nr:30S ribosomal protein S4 [Desulforapulum autotrophicum]C0Q9U8.1 RecName: Full=Small ribosomal subunit protein uS4; AltName: Full=30S ribosomal protein S4 [Desulforapulum autotrophicum HRM2]ACN16666.1 RpsD [Desulforapulum autotrophicum HRM2]
MSRYRGSVCRQCRRENMKLFLKGDRCFSDKCSFDRRSYPPGQHGQRRMKHSDYGIQLREKQKVRRIYGIGEKQFRIIFKKADSLKGITGETLLSLLERRLDNVVFRLGFTSSRTQGRHFVRHNHFTVNGKKVNIPSYIIKAGDVVELKEKSKKVQAITDSLDTVVRRGVPQWLELDKDGFKGVVKGMPAREDITLPIQEQLIVELYSK